MVVQHVQAHPTVKPNVLEIVHVLDTLMLELVN